jgi:hypothetical protein
MKYLFIIVAFVAGVVVGSALFFASLERYKRGMVATDLGRLEEEAIVSEHILNYLDNPNFSNRAYLSSVSSNAIIYFPTNVDLWDKTYPSEKIKLRYELKSESIQKYWREREARTATNSAAREQK